jgi:peptide deformylase
MAILPIVQLGDPVLRVPTVPVRHFGRLLGRLLDDMTDTMRDAPGVGLAANQIGRSERVAIIEVEGRHIELVNPILIRADGTQTDLEGCLSLAGYYAPTTRGRRAAVSALDRRGRSIRVSGKDFLARALQHELDHLDGRVYIDRLESLDALRRAGEHDDDPDDDDSTD